jgi:N-methylhydantoinase A/oxoprolinase/acetone carboxylase beta subunit
MTIHTHRIAIDLGGTFTDFVVSSLDGSAGTLKLSSTPEGYACAIVDQLRLARRAAE